MTGDPLRELLAAGAVPSGALPPTSRYAEVGVDAWDPGDGEPPIPYLRRRLCPPPERLATVEEVRVVDGDRRDIIAARHLGDAALWWRLADANGAIDPRELTEPVGRRLRVTLPAGVRGTGDGA